MSSQLQTNLLEIKDILQDGIDITNEILESKPYYELEYIQSTGTQYIATGVSGSNNLGITGTFQMMNTTYNKYLLGTDVTNDVNAWLSLGNARTEGKLTLYMNWSNGVEINADTNKHTFEIKGSGAGNIIKIDSTTSTPGSLSTSKPIYLFAHNTNNTITNICSARLYELKMYNKTELVRDFIPVQRKSDGVVCLYDKISKTYFENQGTGDFVAGYRKNNLTYWPIQYIQSSGTQHIDTLIKPDGTTNVEIKAQLTKGSEKRDGCLLGVRSSGGSTDSYVLWYNNYQNYNQAEITFRMYSDSNMSYKDSTFVEHTIKQEDKQIYIDNTLQYTSPVRNSSSSYNLYLLSLNAAGTADSRKFLGKLYYTKIYKSNQLVRDFIPCVRKSDNAVCLYDKVSETFFINAGTGTFTAGPEVI